MQLSWFEQIEEEAKIHHIPILPRGGGQFLRWLVALRQPRRVLEIGTAIGYSTLWLAQSLPQDGIIVTIEKDQDRLERARRHLQTAGVLGRVELLLGDAGEILSHLQEQEPFDLVFLDGPKGQYPRYLKLIENLTKPGALLVADNLFLHGLATGQEDPIRYGTMAKRLQEYARLVTEIPCWDTQFVPLGDGFALSLRLADPLAHVKVEME